MPQVQSRKSIDASPPRLPASDHRRPLPAQHHQDGVEGQRQGEVAEDDDGEREHGREIPDLPLEREYEGAADHDGGAGEAEEEGPFETRDDVGDFLAEMHLLDLLGRRAPVHVDAEEVRQDGLREMQREAAEEDGKHGDPLEVVDD